MTEVKIKMMKAEAKGAVFVISLPENASQVLADRVRANWIQVWKDAGHAKAPAGLILQHGITIESLTDNQLKEIGLMKIE